jgi:hypothetical protein
LEHSVGGHSQILRVRVATGGRNGNVERRKSVPVGAVHGGVARRPPVSRIDTLHSFRSVGLVVISSVNGVGERGGSLALGVVGAVKLNGVNELGVRQLVDMHVGSRGVNIDLEQVIIIKFVNSGDGREAYGLEVPDRNATIVNIDSNRLRSRRR